MAPPAKAAIYCRVSTEEQAREGFSIAAQKRTLIQFCSQKGWQLAGIYTDEGLSGKNTERPAFKQLLNDAAHNLFDLVLVWKINRFSRRNADLLTTVEYLEKYNVDLYSYSEQFDASTPSGKLMLSMLGSIGEFERNTIVENIKSGMSEKARQGMFNGGRVLGYDNKDGRLIVNEEEASTVREIFTLCLCGYSLTGIRNTLERMGRKTKNDSHFEISSIKRILQNPIYAGYITYNKTRKAGGKVIRCSDFLKIPGKHQPIISPEEYGKVQQIISSKSQCHTDTGSFILSGILKCPFCGSGMTGCTKGKNKKYRYYVCSAYRKWGTSKCHGIYLNADDCERKVSSFVCSVISGCVSADEIYQRFTSKIIPQSITHEGISSLKKEFANKKRALKKYMKLFEEDILADETLLTRMGALEKEIDCIRKRIDSEKRCIEPESLSNEAISINSIISNFKPVFERLDWPTKKRLVNSIIDEIQIGPGREIECIKILFSRDCMRYTGYNVKCDIHPGDS